VHKKNKSKGACKQKIQVKVVVHVKCKWGDNIRKKSSFGTAATALIANAVDVFGILWL